MVPIQVTLCPIDSCYSLNRVIRHLESSFHLSSTQGGSQYPEGSSPPREDYHLSLSWGIITPWRGLSSLSNPGDYHPLERNITSPLVDFGMLHQYVENSDLLSIFGALHPLPLFPTIILV